MSLRDRCKLLKVIKRTLCITEPKLNCANTKKIDKFEVYSLKIDQKILHFKIIPP